MYELKRVDGSLIATGEDVYEAIYNSKGDLSHANLRGEDLQDARLTAAKLRYTDLTHAYLTDARLRFTDLSHARLRHTDLSHTDLSHARLTGADLTHVILRGAILDGVKWPKELQFTPDPDLKKKIRVQVLNHPQCLNMFDWHSECGTIHCVAGWAIALHPEGKRMEEASSTYLAGRLLLGLDHEEAEIFFSNKETALEWLMED